MSQLSLKSLRKDPKSDLNHPRIMLHCGESFL
jgi:hypothetical protein